MSQHEKLLKRLQILEALEEVEATVGQYVFFRNVDNDNKLFALDREHNSCITSLFPKPMARDEVKEICNRYSMNYTIWEEIKTYDEEGEISGGSISVVAKGING